MSHQIGIALSRHKHQAGDLFDTQASIAEVGVVITVQEEVEESVGQKLEPHPPGTPTTDTYPIPSGRSWYNKLSICTETTELYFAMLRHFRGEFGLKAERPREKLFREIVGALVLGSSSVFLKMGIRFRRNLRRPTQAGASRRLQIMHGSLFNLSSRKVKEMKASLVGTEFLQSVNGTHLFTNRATAMIVDDGYSFWLTTSSRLIKEEELLILLEHYGDFLDWCELHGLAVMYSTAPPFELLMGDKIVNTNHEQRARYEYLRDRLEKEISLRGALIVQSDHYNRGLMKYLMTGSKFFGNFKQYGEDESDITLALSNKVLDMFRYFYYMNPALYVHEALGNFKARMQCLWGPEVVPPTSMALIQYASYSKQNAVAINETNSTLRNYFAAKRLKLQDNEYFEIKAWWTAPLLGSADFPEESADALPLDLPWPLYPYNKFFADQWRCCPIPPRVKLRKLTIGQVLFWVPCGQIFANLADADLQIRSVKTYSKRQDFAVLLSFREVFVICSESDQTRVYKFNWPNSTVKQPSRWLTRKN